tara:strand:+ start:1588 stop:2052 length:465 start_codon:yes stop_codon:yes gene_type:complete
MAYDNFPIQRQFGNTLQWRYVKEDQGTPSSIQLKPENPTNSNLLITTITVSSTGASTWDFLPSGVADITGVSYRVDVNGPDDSITEMSYVFPPAKAVASWGFSTTLSKEILLRPEFGFSFNVSSIIDSSGSDNMAVRIVARGTIVDPATFTPFT